MNAIEDWKNGLPAAVSAEITLASYSELGDMLRVDLEQIPVFVPRTSVRQHEDEDTTINRVCVCDSLMGCITGYASFFHDFSTGTPDGKWTLNGIPFKGGMYIHKMPYDYLAVPSNKLSGDSSASGEKWLVPYDAEHAQYPSELIGKIFIGSYVSRRYDHGSPANTYTIYLEIAEGNTLKLTPTRTLYAGYWKLTQTVRYIDGNVRITEEPIALEQQRISSDEYFQAKGEGIDLLSQKIKAAALWK